MFMMSTLALGANDPTIRSELAEMAVAYTGFKGDEKLHPDAIDPNLMNISLLVATDEHGAPFTDLLWQHFKQSDNAHDRQLLLGAMAHSIDPKVAAAVRERILSPELKDNEVPGIFWRQMEREENRKAMWSWTQVHIDAALERIPNWRKGKLPGYFDQFCSLEEAIEVENTFLPIIDTLESGPRTLANTLETIRLCAAFVDSHKSTSGE